MQKFAAIQPPKRAPKKVSAFDFMLNIAMILACIAIVAVFAYGILS
jgi:hypothetical protein